MDARYSIDRKIAAGGMATVYLGRRLGSSQPVAMKVCHPHLLGAEHRIEALLDEARIASQIRHPNVVATLDVVAHGESVMIVMEYVEGLTVAGLVRSAERADRQLPIEVALRVARDAIAGLHAAHELRDDEGRALDVVHRDVSPQNILVGVDGIAKLADFGVFKGARRLAPSTETGDLKGKLGYVAPEVYRGEPVSRRADIYAAGVVLWEMLAGRRLFDDETHAAMMHRVLAGRVPPLAVIREDVPYEIDAVLARALALDPGDRYATAHELVLALERLPVAAADAGAVAQHVRAAMRAEPGTVTSIAPSSMDLDADHVLATGELLTPSEYVTPVRTARPGSRARAMRFASALGALLAVAALALGATFSRSSSVQHDGARASARVARSADVVRATLASDVPRGMSMPPARPVVKEPRVRPRPVTPGPAAGKLFYDPEEL